MLALVGEAHALAMRGEIRRAAEVRDLYVSVKEQCSLEPVASSFDHGLMLFGVLFAEYASNRRRWDRAYRCCAAVLNLLAALARRRAELGLSELPHSEVRWCVLRVLADIKWQQDESERDRLMTPAGIVSEFWRIHNLVRPRLLDDDLRPLHHRRNLLDSLNWCHLAVCKLAYRYLRDSEYLTLAMKFNRNLDAPAVALGEGHWRSCELSGRRLFYLDFEIAKSWLSGKLDCEVLERLHYERWAAAEAESQSWQYFDSLRREYEWMRRHCPRPLEVVSA